MDRSVQLSGHLVVLFLSQSTAIAIKIAVRQLAIRAKQARRHESGQSCRMEWVGDRRYISSSAASRSDPPPRDPIRVDVNRIKGDFSWPQDLVPVPSQTRPSQSLPPHPTPIEA